MKQFLWTPGQGVDPLALQRLRSHFRRPSKPMGEAWFMGDDRQMYPQLLGDLDRLSTEELQEFLAEIASGTSSFGPVAEWDTWYHYLLGALVPRSHEWHFSYLLESLMTGFMAMYPNGVVREPYKGFHKDALLTLGRSIMDCECWSGPDVAIGKVLHHSNDNPNQVWGWWDASGDLSSSMFFCLKYLPESAVEPWLRSVLDIPSPHWRAQVMVWLVGAHELLNGAVRWPSEFSLKAHPDIGWEWSHCLRSEMAAADESGATPAATFIPHGSRTAAQHVVRSYFGDDAFLDWLECISAVPYLQAELAAIPSTFEMLYVRPACP